MLLSLGIYLGGARALPQDQMRQDEMRQAEKEAGGHGQDEPQGDDAHGRRAARAIIGVCAAVALFWAAYDQQGNTILLWAEDFTNRAIDIGFWRGEIPSPWFLALNPFCIFVFTPVIVHLWARLGERGREPSPIRKMAFGAACLTLANLVMATAAGSASGKASPFWLVGYFVLATIGELHVAPVGLALISKEAPLRSLSMLMGVWFAATLPADVFGGFLGGFWSGMAKPHFFLMIALIAGCASLALRVQGSAIRDQEPSRS
jgi:POT family proton-dependent oligopeptide transporter